MTFLSTLTGTRTPPSSEATARRSAALDLDGSVADIASHLSVARKADENVTDLWTGPLGEAARVAGIRDESEFRVFGWLGARLRAAHYPLLGVPLDPAGTPLFGLDERETPGAIERLVSRGIVLKSIGPAGGEALYRIAAKTLPVDVWAMTPGSRELRGDR